MNEGTCRLTPGAILLGVSGEPLILASASPRRRALLHMLGLRYECVVPQVSEDGPHLSESPAERVEHLARLKAAWVPRERLAYAVLAADTVVWLDGEIFGKPADEAEARRFLMRLSDRWHDVYTGVCLRRLSDERTVVGHERSRVRFGSLSEQDIRDYIATGEPMDKAGAYGIQGYGGLLVERIEGCYFNVMGLPLSRLRRLAHELEGRS